MRDFATKYAFTEAPAAGNAREPDFPVPAVNELEQQLTAYASIPMSRTDVLQFWHSQKEVYHVQ